MTPEQLAELFVEDTGDNITGIATDIEILLKQAYKSGYKYAVDKVCDIVNHYCNRTGVYPSRRVDIINHIRKEMEE